MPAAIPESWKSVLTVHSRQLTIACNSSSKGYNTLCILYHTVTPPPHTHTEANTYMHAQREVEERDRDRETNKGRKWSYRDKNKYTHIYGAGVGADRQTETETERQRHKKRKIEKEGVNLSKDLTASMRTAVLIGRTKKVHATVKGRLTNFG